MARGNGLERQAEDHAPLIKPGDALMPALENSKYGLRRILSQVSLGRVAEILDAELAEPSLNAVSVDALRRRGRPTVVDSYGLFDKKLEGDWCIISHQDGFVPSNVDGVFFTHRPGPLRKRVDVFGQVEEVPTTEAAGLPLYTPKGDEQVKQEFFAAHCDGVGRATLRRPFRCWRVATWRQRKLR